MADSSDQRFNAERVEEYKAFDKVSFSWEFIEAPAISEGVSNLINEDTVLLDLGSGTGRVIQHLAGEGLELSHAYGLDISSKMVEEASKRFPKAHFRQGNIQDLPYPDDMFDVVVSNLVLHFLDDNELQQTLRSIARVVRKGGRYFCVESNPYQEPDNLQLGEWVTTKTPWGAEIAAFRHDYKKLFAGTSEEGGLACESIVVPNVLPGGKEANPAEYQRYTQIPLRICATLRKVQESPILN